MSEEVEIEKHVLAKEINSKHYEKNAYAQTMLEILENELHHVETCEECRKNIRELIQDLKNGIIEEKLYDLQNTQPALFSMIGFRKRVKAKPLETRR